MNKEFIEEIKKKREFSKLPDSVIVKVASETTDLKEARALLRKYFGVFLTNRVIKGKGSSEEILRAHISSKKRDYGEFYRSIFEGYDLGFEFVLDFGAGVNGYSYSFLREIIGDTNYFAFEASGQLVDNMNSFFDENHFAGRALHKDVMDLKFINEFIAKSKGKKVIFMFQLIDALENLERDFSKKFLLSILTNLTVNDLIVISLPVESLSGKTNFNVRRKWLVDFLEEKFSIEKDFLQNGERILCIRKK